MPPAPPPDLIDDAIAEILLRIPPDEPEHLFRAALVCKPWLRILTDPKFLSRYRVLHRAPPLLGYLCIEQDRMPSFVPTTAASPLTMLPHDPRICGVCDCRHGRVLMCKICSSRSERLIVWDPITGHQKNLNLTVPNSSPPIFYAGAAVLCPVDGCYHLNCHGGAFRVVYCGLRQDKIVLFMYTSEIREWSSMISIDAADDFRLSCSTLIGNALYFRLQSSLSVLKYDFGRHEVSVISSPGVLESVPMKLDDGGLGFVGVCWAIASTHGHGKPMLAMALVAVEMDTVLPRPSSGRHGYSFHQHGGGRTLHTRSQVKEGEEIG